MTFDRKTHKKFRTTNLQKNVTIKERVREERRDARGTGDRKVLSRFSIRYYRFPAISIFPLSFEISLNFLPRGFKGIGAVMQTAHRCSLRIVCRLRRMRFVFASAGNFFANPIPLSFACLDRGKTATGGATFGFNPVLLTGDSSRRTGGASIIE